jgi:diadenosine tetraphosphate (Ap4A) HIT family hydrolase
METCSLCSPSLAPKIVDSTYWMLVLNHNQRFLGACFWVLHRHLETITGLTSSEWADLHPQVIRATQALVHHFRPDHFNYAFLQNQDRHVHLHLFPRYAQPRVFAGVTFEDADYPSHYTVPAPSRHLLAEQYELIAQALRSALETTRAS